MNPYSIETMIAEMKFKLEKSDPAAEEYFNDCLRTIDYKPEEDTNPLKN